MTVLEQVAGLWFAVLDASAQAAAELSARLSRRQRLLATEDDTGQLRFHPEGRPKGRDGDGLVLPPLASAEARSRPLRGRHVTLELAPDRFVFQTIELPGRATEFIEAIVRNQIDRLTPWRAEQAAFGWCAPAPAGGTMQVVVAATDRTMVQPLIEHLRLLGAATVVARVAAPVRPDAPVAATSITILSDQSAAKPVLAWRRRLGLATAAVVLLVIGSSMFGQIASFELASAADAVARETAAKRASIVRAKASDDPAAAPAHAVEQRKNEAPFATLVVDAVSRILPDNSYVTSLELSGTRLRLVGYTTDAPALIRLIDASSVLTEASFFAPTTHLPEDRGDRFNIEATVRPDAFVR